MDVVDEVLFSTLIQLNGRPYAILAFTMAIVVYLSFRNRKNLISTLSLQALLISCVFFVGCYVFQVLAYTLAFTKYEASKAASFARYMAPPGLIIFVALGLSGSSYYQRFSRKSRVITNWFLFSVAVAIIVSASAKIVPEKRINPRIQDIAAVIRQIFPPGERLTLIDVQGNGFDATAVRFFLDGHNPTNFHTNYPDPTKPISLEKINDWRRNAKNLYILSGPKYMYEALGFPKEIFIEAEKLATSNIQGTELTLVTTDENKIKAQQLAMLLHWVFQIKIINAEELVSDAREISQNNTKAQTLLFTQSNECFF